MKPFTCKLFVNKNNGQMSVALPKKKMKVFLKKQKEFPKELKISLWNKN